MNQFRAKVAFLREWHKLDCIKHKGSVGRMGVEVVS